MRSKEPPYSPYPSPAASDQMLNQITEMIQQQGETPPPLSEQVTLLEQQLADLKAENAALKTSQLREQQRRKSIEQELRTSRHMLQIVMDTLPSSIFWKDQDSVFLGCNQNFAADAGFTKPEDLIGKTDYDMPWKKEESDFYRECDRRVMKSGQAEFGIIEPQLNSRGEDIWLETNKAPLHDIDGNLVGLLGTYQDITERHKAEIALLRVNKTLEQQTVELSTALEQLKQSQVQLIKQEKMSALGSLISGVAHEINNPLGSLIGNIQALEGYSDDLLELLDVYGDYDATSHSKIIDKIEDIDLDFVREDLPKVFGIIKESVKYLTHISKSLRGFSRTDAEHPVAFQVHEGLETTLLILKHRLKGNPQRPAIIVTRTYGELPLIQCFPGQLNQVFMNIVANAIDALDEFNHDKSFTDIQSQAQPSNIHISTRLSEDQQWAIISIGDNGTGISEVALSKIFDSAFTTKEVGKGTGLGLAIAQQIIVEKHGGSLDVVSNLGQGTEFIIKVPVSQGEQRE